MRSCKVTKNHSPVQSKTKVRVLSPSHLAIVLVHTVRNVQDPIHLHIVWIKRLLFLQRTTRSETKASG